jgi:hypothetical protein
MVWWDYSGTSSTIQRALDQSVAIGIGCFFIGCHRNTQTHTISGPTSREHAESMASSLVAMATPLEIPEAGLAEVDMKGISNLVKNWLGEDYKAEFSFYRAKGDDGVFYDVPQWKFSSADDMKNIRVHGPHWFVSEFNEDKYVLRIGEQVPKGTPGALKNPFGNDFWLYYDALMNITGDKKAMHIPTNTDSFVTVFHGLRNLFK